MIAVCNLLRPDDVPENYRDLVIERQNDKREGGSCIIAPGGEVIAAAATNEEIILTASVSLEAVLQLKAVIDVGAHYSRPDVLQLHVNRSPIEPIVEHTRSEYVEPPGAITGANESFVMYPSADGNEQGTETIDSEGP